MGPRGLGREERTQGWPAGPSQSAPRRSDLKRQTAREAREKFVCSPGWKSASASASKDPRVGRRRKATSLQKKKGKPTRGRSVPRGSCSAKKSGGNRAQNGGGTGGGGVLSGQRRRYKETRARFPAAGGQVTPETFLEEKSAGRRKILVVAVAGKEKKNP